MKTLAKIYCPKCEWTPGCPEWPGVPVQDWRWRCAPGCGSGWNTFQSKGVCPNCGKLWTDTQCPECHAWSQHDLWYHLSSSTASNDAAIVRHFLGCSDTSEMRTTSRLSKRIISAVTEEVADSIEVKIVNHGALPVIISDISILDGESTSNTVAAFVSVCPAAIEYSWSHPGVNQYFEGESSLALFRLSLTGLMERGYSEDEGWELMSRVKAAIAALTVEIAYWNPHGVTEPMIVASTKL